MPDRTPEWDAQDAIDRDLLARGEIGQLLAGYKDLIQKRCRARCKGHGEDVAQQVFLRLWRELSDGKHRDGKPFREIVNGVTAFACRGYEGTTLVTAAPLEEWAERFAEGSYDDVADEVVARIDMEDFLDDLEARRPSDAEIARLRMQRNLEVDQIADITGKKANAIYAALLRIRRAWQEWVEKRGHGWQDTN